MKKQITTIAITIFMLAGVMAMYAGESRTFETEFDEPIYTVIGNSSNLEGLNITFENGNITISPVINYKPDNFTLIFFDNKTKEVIRTIYTGNEGSSSGGGTTRYVDRNVTVYVPEYINNTETIEVIEIVYTKEGGSRLIIILFIFGGLVAGLISGIIIYKYFKNKDATNKNI